jgi:alanyl-tRNA synthetase
VRVLADQMGEAYPELVKNAEVAMRVLKQEEERFAETLSTGMSLLEQEIAGLRGAKVIAGKAVFKLYDTYGFPVDLTADIARERGLSVDQAGFEAAMEAQRERARAASGFKVDLRADVALDVSTAFCGYEALEGVGRVVAIFRDGSSVERLGHGEQGQVVLDSTPFYAESGGQVGDVGVLHGEHAEFTVEDTRKLGKAHAHVGTVARGKLEVGDRVTARVDAETRQATVLNHSATHLLHAALREVLGDHVTQKGSLVAPDRLRFDFSHFQPVTPQELERIERKVNAEIRRNAPAEIRLMSYDDAIASGAMALFGEKYGDEVRVLSLGEFSTELCGGTHVRRAGDIGLFRIIGESGVAAGVRRIEAVTGENALDHDAATETTLRHVASLVKGSPADVEDKVRQLIERQKKLEREVSALKSRLASGQGVDLAETAVELSGVKVVAARVDGADAKSLREAVDALKGKLKTAVIVLGAPTEDGKVLLVAGVTGDLTGKVKAGELVGKVAAAVGGKGGGRPDFAQAGGTEPGGLDAALVLVHGLVEQRLGQGRG